MSFNEVPHSLRSSLFGQFYSNFPQLHPDCLQSIFKPYLTSWTLNTLILGLLHYVGHVWSITYDITMELGFDQNVRSRELPVSKRSSEPFGWKWDPRNWFWGFSLNLTFSTSSGVIDLVSTHEVLRFIWRFAVASQKWGIQSSFLLLMTSEMNLAQPIEPERQLSILIAIFEFLVKMTANCKRNLRPCRSDKFSYCIE